MAATVERKRPWLFEGYKEEEGTAVVTLTVPRRLAWGLGMRSKGERVDLGMLCFAALAALVKARRIPWSWFDEILASERQETPKTGVQEGEGKPVDGIVGPAVSVEPSPALQAIPESGGGEGEAQPPARPPIDRKAAAAKLFGKPGRKSSGAAA